jgi:hypothetical protein
MDRPTAEMRKRERQELLRDQNRYTVATDKAEVAAAVTRVIDWIETQSEPVTIKAAMHALGMYCGTGKPSVIPRLVANDSRILIVSMSESQSSCAGFSVICRKESDKRNNERAAQLVKMGFRAKGWHR